jgi:hypothetical protein
VRTARPVVDRAVVGEAAPGVEPGRCKPQDAQGDSERDGLLGGSDSGQDRTFRLAIGHALGVEAETRETNEEECEPDDSEEKSDSPTECEDLGLQFRMVQGEDLGGDDRARTSADPAGSSRARNSEVSEQARVVLLAHEVAHPVVI